MPISIKYSSDIYYIFFCLQGVLIVEIDKFAAIYGVKKLLYEEMMTNNCIKSYRLGKKWKAVKNCQRKEEKKIGEMLR